MSGQAAKAPWHYWAVAVVSSVWNGFGGVDYTMTKLRNLDYLTKAAGSRAEAERMLAVIDAFPVWATTLWALGVWGSVLGSVLLLVRSRHAVAAFFVSLVSAAASFAYQFAAGSMHVGKDWLMTVIILGAVVFFWWYARASAARGLLR
ncbi:MAG: hypothetical protein ABI673_11615 [Novosphingobium sp.]